MIPYFMMHNRAGTYLYEDLTTAGIRPIAVSFKKREESIFTIHLGGTDKLLAWTEEEDGRVHWTTDYNDRCDWLILGSPLTYTYILANSPGRPMLRFSDDNRLVIKEGDVLSWGLSPTYCPYSK